MLPAVSRDPELTVPRDEVPVGRFAPSPTGRMHAGNIFAALVQYLLVKSRGGRIVLRIEDLDRDRSKAEFINQIPEDFERLHLFWDEGPYFQHDRDEVYSEVFRGFEERGLIYPCYCSRADLLAGSAPHRGEKTVYSGRCRDLDEIGRLEASQGRVPAFRLRVPEADYSLEDLIQGTYTQNLATECGDYIVRRSDGAFAYQLAVVVDDAAQGVNCICRGVDLLCSTPQQLFMQDLLGAPHPEYAHVPLLTASTGVRLSKRNKDASLDDMLAVLGSPEAVIGHIAFITGLADTPEPCFPDDLLATFDVARLRERWQGLIEIPWVAPRGSR